MESVAGVRYLKVVDCTQPNREENTVYQLAVPNLETRRMFLSMMKGWFSQDHGITLFSNALLSGDMESMEAALGKIMKNTMSAFDPGTNHSEPEKFYHGLVLGLLAETLPTYVLRSNRESGFGRYDVILEPKDLRNPAVIMEFKVFNPGKGEHSMEDTAKHALQQIREKQYDAELIARGSPKITFSDTALHSEGKNA